MTLCSHGNHESQAAHVRLARSDRGPGDLEILVRGLSQRLDTLEADNQALRSELESVREENQVLEGRVAELQRAGEHPATTIMSTSAPFSTPPAAVTGAPAGTSTGEGGASLQTLKNEVEALRERGHGVESQLQDLLTLSQTLQNSLTLPAGLFCFFHFS